MRTKSVAAYLAVCALLAGCAHDPGRELDEVSAYLAPDIQKHLDRLGPACIWPGAGLNRERNLYITKRSAMPSDRPLTWLGPVDEEGYRRLPYDVVAGRLAAVVEAGLVAKVEDPPIKTDDVYAPLHSYNKDGGFCYGKRTLVRVVELTPVLKIDCWRVRDVRVEYRFSDVPDWIRRPGMVEAFPDAPRVEGEIVTLELPLMLHKDGWRLHWFDPIHGLYLCMR